MSEIDGRSNAAEPDEVVELEPTQAYPAIEPASSQRSFHMALVAGSAPSISSENEILLRNRLKAAAIFLAVAYAVFFVVGLMDVQGTIARAAVYLGFRVALCVGLAAFLASPVGLSLPTLRMLEYGFFGVLVLMMMIAQYVLGSTLIHEGDFPHLVAVEKNGVLNFLVVMVLYGVFIPNKPSMTARVVLTMALGPLIVLALFAAQGGDRRSSRSISSPRASSRSPIPSLFSSPPPCRSTPPMSSMACEKT